MKKTEEKQLLSWLTNGKLTLSLLWFLFGFSSLSCCLSFPSSPLCSPLSYPLYHIFSALALWNLMLSCVKSPINTSSKTGQILCRPAARPHSSVRLTGCVAGRVLLRRTLCVSEPVCLWFAGWSEGCREIERKTEARGISFALVEFT